MPTRKCPICGSELAEGALEGLCPKCVVKQAMAEGQASATNATTISSGEIKIETTPETLPPQPKTRLRYFGDYELIEEIARGGMGVVYKARQVSLNRTVAVKMILAGNLASEVEVKRFLQEARAAANLQHPNIVAIHEVGEHEGQHYFSMDYVAGKNLAQVAKDGPLSAKQAAQYLKTMSEAVHFAHQRGTLHRDLKPHNVLLDPFDQPRITDFGLAKQLAQESTLTHSSAVMGSPSYMAPEQAAGRNDLVGPATDVYGLGAILYHLLTGRAPFAGTTPVETLRQVQEAEPVAPSKLNPRLPSDLETICLKCLEKKPERRYATARALAEDLERFLNHEPILARRPSLARKAWSWTVHHPWVITGLISTGLLLLTGFMFNLWEENKFLHWKEANLGRPPAFKTTQFFSKDFMAFLFLEALILQVLPLMFFNRARVQGKLGPRKCVVFTAIGLIQVIFAGYLVLRLNALLVWVGWPKNFPYEVWLVALTNLWFGFRLVWHGGAQLRLGHTGGAWMLDKRPYLFQVGSRRRLFWLAFGEVVLTFIIVRLVYEAAWSEIPSNLALLFGMNLVAAFLWVCWRVRGEERLVYLPPLLLSFLLLLLGLDSHHDPWDLITLRESMWASLLFYRPWKGSLLMFGFIASLALVFYVRLEGGAAETPCRLKKPFFVGIYAIAGVLLLITAGYQFENWRGRKTWEHTKSRLQGKGAHLDWSYYIPKPIPDAQNILKAPRMETWFVRGGTNRHKETEIARQYYYAKGWRNKANGGTVAEIILLLPGDSHISSSNELVLDERELNAGKQRFDPSAQLAGIKCRMSSVNLILAEKLPGLTPRHIYLRVGQRPKTEQVAALLHLNTSQLSLEGGTNLQLQAFTAQDYLQWSDRFRGEFDQIRAALKRDAAYLRKEEPDDPNNNPYGSYGDLSAVGVIAEERALAFLLLIRPDEALDELVFLFEFRRRMADVLSPFATWNVNRMGDFEKAVHAGTELGVWSERHYAQLQPLLNSIDLSPMMARGLAKERVYNLYFCQAMAEPHRYSSRFGFKIHLNFALTPRGWYYQAMSVWALASQEAIECINLTNGVVSTRRLSHEGELWLEKVIPLPHFGDPKGRIVYLEKSIQSLAKTQTYIGLSSVACALERHRFNHGQYPETLAELIPQFLDRIPHDIVNGQPLKYRRERPDKFILYSIGWDLKDDGGLEPGDWIRNSRP